MSVANTLKTPIVAPCIDIQYAGAGGPSPPGLYLPLAGGTMDSLPNGVINAHTIVGPPGGQFDLLAGAGGDVGMFASTGTASISGQSAGVSGANGVDINSTSGGNVGIDTTGSVQVGSILTPSDVIMNTINQVDIHNRCLVNPNGVAPIVYTNDDFGLRVSDYINNAGNNQSGVWVQKIGNTAGDTYGIRVDDLNGLGNNTGVHITNVLTQAGNVIGCSIDAINANLGNEAKGININGVVSGASGAYGIDITTTTGGPGQEACAIRIQDTFSDTNVCRGVLLANTNSLTGNVVGFEVKSMQTASSGSAYAFVGGNINTENGPAIGVNLANINATTGTGSGAFGSYIQNVVGTTDATGYSIITCDAIAGPAVGVQVAQVNASGSGLGNENATGVSVQGVFCSATSGMTATGVKVFQAQGDLAAGVQVNGITALTNDAYGIDIRDVAGPNISRGVYINNVSSSGNDAYGLHIGSVSSIGGGAYGIYQFAGTSTISNFFHNNIECGSGESASSTNASLNVFGTIQSSVQSSAAATYTILNNRGNVVISLAGNTAMNMPTFRYIGAIYTITKKHGGGVTINGNGANINGAATFNHSGAIYGTMTIVWDGTEWLAHLN